MNERIKELAEQAGLHHWDGLPLEMLERFAELIWQDKEEACAEQYLEIMRGAVEQAVLREREACADLCDEEANQSSSDYEAIGMYWCADAIRARGEK